MRFFTKNHCSFQRSSHLLKLPHLAAGCGEQERPIKREKLGWIRFGERPGKNRFRSARFAQRRKRGNGN